MTRICMTIPSRGRPRQLEATLRALKATESEQHEVIYAVSYCRHDEQTLWAAKAAGANAYMRPDDCTPGAAYNHASSHIEAEIYTGFADDVFPLTWGWDDYLHLALHHPLVAFCWQEVTDDKNTSYGAIAGRALKAIGKPCPEYFPYWFNDLWLAEIHHLAFGFRPSLVDGLKLGGKRGTTQGLRDFPFWCQVFTYTRPERLRLAIRLAAEYGSTPPDIRAALEICRLFDADFLKQNERFTARFGETGPPDRAYTLAKERAEAMLSQPLTAA